VFSIDVVNPPQVCERNKHAARPDDGREGVTRTDNADAEITLICFLHKFDEFRFAVRRCLVLRHAVLVADPITPDAALFEFHRVVPLRSP